MRRQGPLFLELVCCILLFALCAMVCIAVLLQAHQLTGESQRLTQGVVLAQNTAEALRAGGNPDQLEGPQGDYQVALAATADGWDITILWGDQAVYALKGVDGYGS